MTGVLAVTADGELRGLLAECADRAGVFLHAYDEVVAARQVWAEAALILLGADQVTAAVRARLHPRGGVIVVGGTGLDPETVRVAELIRAAYLVVLPTGRDWLADQLRPAGAVVLDRLRAARFSVGYTDRARAVEQGYVRPLDWRERADTDRRHAYVMLSDVARGECRSGQSTTVQRSNMRSLHRVFPGVFTDMTFSNVTVLGAFVADLSPRVVDVLCRLACEYLVFDEDDLSALEHDEVHASWQQWVAADVYRRLGDRASAVWDELTDEDCERLWWEVVAGLDAWPEHDARTVLWRLGRLTQAYAARLTAEARRRARTQRTLVAA